MENIQFDRNELSFLTTVLNSQWHVANETLRRKDLGDLERKAFEFQKAECERLMFKIEGK